jgi:acyl-CoA reductase-like NAD-dependent aldehyde dehydrogenase
VFDGVYDRFEAEVASLVGRLVQDAPLCGRPVDVGAMITPQQLAVVERLVERAVAQGARVVAGGKAVLRERGDFFAPTILADCTPEMEIMHEEVFGPVMLLCRVSSDDEAVEIANGTSYGLSSSVFSKDHARARRIADRLQTGSTVINDFGLIYMAQELPFGGVKRSGFGRMNGREGLRACCNQKAVVADRFPIHFANQLYPVGPRTYSTMRNAIRLIYSRGWASRAQAVWEAIRSWRSNSMS